MNRETETPAPGPPVLGVAGRSNSGKTTLIERLVPVLKARGLSVAVIKHAAHGFDMDRPGKDSFRHMTAGAYGVAVASPGALAVVKRTPGEADPLALAAAFFPEADLILLEGYKRLAAPKIEVLGFSPPPPPPACEGDPLLLALVFPGPVPDAGLPVFSPDEPERLADWITATILPRPPAR
ncbi:MAG: molybdopterin-guanine dinucleotide biosynthesis protein B [Proteobacteria bacterium]|nr:molybdopterin-guanine dinucleotide biosynthesis protein B [Pseudomonadota bacterium]